MSQPRPSTGFWASTGSLSVTPTAFDESLWNRLTDVTVATAFVNSKVTLWDVMRTSGVAAPTIPGMPEYTRAAFWGSGPGA